MTKNNLTIIAPISLLLLSSSLLVQAEERKTSFEIQVGASIAKFDSDITINGDERDNNASVDMEDELNLDDDVDIYAFKGTWRMAKNHRLSLEYIPFSRSSSVTLDKDFAFEDDEIQVGADVSTNADYRVYDVNYIYSFYNTPTLELGVSAGIYWMDLDVSINASGDIEDASGSTSYHGDYRNSAATNIPLPLLGLTADYQLTPDWALHGMVRYFDLEIDNYEGSISSVVVGADYAVHESLSVGLSVLYFDLGVGAESDSFNGSYNWAYSGAQLYLVTRF